MTQTIQRDSISPFSIKNKKLESFIFRGYKVRYVRAGIHKPSEAPILFLHNGGNDHRIWDYQLEEFSKKYEVFALDHLGYGESEKPDIDYSLQLYAGMLKCFIEKMKFESVILVGNCVGSAMSLYYTIKHPEKVKKLILFNLLTEKSLSHGEFSLLLNISKALPMSKFFIRFGAKKMILPRIMRLLAVKSLYGSKKKPVPEFFTHVTRLYKNSRQLSVLSSLLLNSNSFKILDKFSKPKDFPPICLIWGKKNHVLSVRGGNRLLEQIKPDQSWFVNDCGHMVMREEAIGVNKFIEQFLLKN